MATDAALGKRVRAAREARGWTNQRLAAEARVAPGTIGRIEHGQRVHAGNLAKVLSVLDINRDADSDWSPDVDAAMICVGEWLQRMPPEERVPAMMRLGRLIGNGDIDTLTGATRRERRAIADARVAEERRAAEDKEES